jgi:protein involved in polysaccharide export with SLBB domain
MTGSEVVHVMYSWKLLRALSLLALAALLPWLTGCSSQPGPAVRSSYVEFTPEQKLQFEAQGPHEYRLQEGDVLRIAFPYERDLTQEGVVVLNDGSVNLVGVDRIVVAGRTVTEADSLITMAYAREYVEPNLSVIVQETRGRQIYVLGEVKSPGLYRLPMGGIDVLGAVAMAGGLNSDAESESAVVVRVSQEGFLAQEIDLSHVGDGAYASLALVRLEPLDVVYVPRSSIGDFAYFSRSILAGLGQITRIASDIYYLSNGGIGRY